MLRRGVARLLRARAAARGARRGGRGEGPRCRRRLQVCETRGIVAHRPIRLDILYFLVDAPGPEEYLLEARGCERPASGLGGFVTRRSLAGGEPGTGRRTRNRLGGRPGYRVGLGALFAPPTRLSIGPRRVLGRVLEPALAPRFRGARRRRSHRHATGRAGREEPRWPGLRGVRSGGLDRIPLRRLRSDSRLDAGPVRMLFECCSSTLFEIRRSSMSLFDVALRYDWGIS